MMNEHTSTHTKNMQLKLSLFISISPEGVGNKIKHEWSGYPKHCDRGSSED